MRSLLKRVSICILTKHNFISFQYLAKIYQHISTFHFPRLHLSLEWYFMYYFGVCINPCKSKVNQTWKNDIHWIGTFSTFLKIFISTFLSEYYAHVDTSLSALFIVFLFQLKCKNRPDPDSFIFGALFRFFFLFWVLFSLFKVIFFSYSNDSFSLSKNQSSNQK